jgi:O-succinylbenzoate synthase
VNVTVPAVGPEQAAAIVARSGCRTAKVKVAERGQAEAEDIERVEAVRDALGPDGRIRVDANGAWEPGQAARVLRRLARFGLEYAEQPCATLDELAELRRHIDIPVAADESIRRAEDPLRVRAAGAADIVMLKVQPLGGVRAALAWRVAASRSWCRARWTLRSGWPPGWRWPPRSPNCPTPAVLAPCRCWPGT